MAAYMTRCVVCFFLTLTIFVVASSTSRSCPLFCQCSNEQIPGEIRVNCPYDTVVLPELSTNVTDVTFKNKLLPAVAGFDFDGAPFLRRLRLDADNLLYINKDAFHGLSCLLSVTVASKRRVTMDDGVFNNVGTLSLLSLRVGLTSVPAQVCNATGLETLQLSRNSITSATFPQCARNLRNLRQVELSGNPLRTVDSQDFFPLRNINISVLLVSDCRLTTLPQDIFQYFPNLKILNVGKNKIASLPAGIFANVKYLTQLTLAETSLHGLPLEDNLPFIKGLKQLDLSRNKEMNMSFGAQFLNATRLHDLILSGSNIGKLEDLTFSAFSRSPITILQLSSSRIDGVSTASLKPLTHLRQLYLDENPINEKAVQNISMAVSGSLEHLSLQNAHVQKLDNTTFRGFTRENNLTVLTLKNNKPHLQVGSNAFQSFHNLQTLSLASCSMTLDSLSQNALAGLSSLQKIDLSNNRLVAVPRIRDIGNLSSLTGMDLSHNSISSLQLQDLFGYEGLQWLDLGYNNLYVISVALQQLQNLETLDLRDNKITSIKPGAFQGLSKLKYLRLDQNIIVTYSDRTLPTNVLELRLSYNANLGRSKELARAFSQMSQVRKLQVDNCGMQGLPLGIFNNNSNLTLLDLSHNSIAVLDPLVFKPLSALESLFLRLNRITTFSETSFAYLISLKVLDLALNPLACTCDLVWFKHWLNNMELYLLEYDNNGSYVCSSPDEIKGVPLLKFTLTPVDCSSKTVTYVMIALTVGLVFVCALTSLVCRYWWYFRYYMFLLRSRRRLETDALLDGEAFQYDVYVCYHSSSRRWVIEHLVPELEDNGGLKLCLHDRDWLPGRSTLDNVVESIESSRKTLLLVNNAFASSESCRQETALAYQRLHEGQNNLLVVILLEDIEQENMDRTLRLVLAFHTYLVWTAGPKKRARSWKRLRRTLRREEHRVAGVEMLRA